MTGPAPCHIGEEDSSPGGRIPFRRAFKPVEPQFGLRGIFRATIVDGPDQTHGHGCAVLIPIGNHFAIESRELLSLAIAQRFTNQLA